MDNQIDTFDEVLMKNDYNHYDDEESKIRNKSVVIPRSSILLKNKKNMQKRNQEIKPSDSFIKNYSVSPSKIVFAPKRVQRGKGSNNRDYEIEDSLRLDISKEPFRNLNKAKINLKANNIFQNNDTSNTNINDKIKKNKIKFVRNKIAPFKFIKNKRKTDDSEEISSIKSKFSCFFIHGIFELGFVECYDP